MREKNQESRKPLYKILVIEDDTNMRELLKKTLLLEGFDCRTAASAREGFEALVKDKSDLAVVDVQLPDENGIELCRRIKADAGLKHTAVVIMTGEARSVESRVAGLDAGADGYLLKPFSLKELLARVKGILSTSTRPTRQ